MRLSEIIDSSLEETDRSKPEKAQILAIQNRLDELKGSKPYINLWVGDRSVEAAYAVKTTPGNPKSDCTILDSSKNPVAWVSLKGPSHYWGRWIRLMKHYQNPDNVDENPGLDRFVENVRNITGGVLQPKESFTFNLVTMKSRMQVMYGIDFGKERGIENVDLIIKKDPRIEPRGSTFVLTGDESYANGKLPPEPKIPRAVIHFTNKRVSLGIKNASFDTEPSDYPRNALPLNTLEQIRHAEQEIKNRRLKTGLDDQTVNQTKGNKTNVPPQRSQLDLFSTP